MTVMLKPFFFYNRSPVSQNQWFSGQSAH